MHPIVSLLSKTAKFYSRMTDPSNAVVEEAFIKIMGLLNKSALKHSVWLCGGALLGYAREGKLLKHDKDIDFHYWIKDTHLLEEFLYNLNSRDFKYCYSLKNNAGIITQHTIQYKKVKIDFFLAEQINSKLQWFCYTTKHWHRPARQFLNAISSVELEETNFYGLPVMKPKNHDAYLSELYGNWKIPAKDYTYYIDSHAIIASEPWSQEK